MMRAGFAVLVGALCLNCIGATTRGTSFLIGFMDNEVEQPQDLPVEIYVDNSNTGPVTVTVSSPKASCASQTATVPAGSVGRFVMCWWLRQTKTDFWPIYKTILVEASNNVRVYGVNKETFSADGFYVIPVAQLGYTYYVTGYTPVNLNTHFSVHATTEGVACEITVPKTAANGVPIRAEYYGRVYRNGDTFRISLKQYESYYTTSLGDLSGTRISCTDKVAVFSGNIRSKESSTSRDHLATQLAPTGDWGVEFFARSVPRISFFGDLIRVVAQFDGTTVTLQENGVNNKVFNINQGEVLDTEISGATRISSTRPVQVTQIVRSQAGANVGPSEYADPLMFNLPTTNQWVNNYRTPVIARSPRGGETTAQMYGRRFLYIAVRSGEESSLRLDGFTFTASWSDISNMRLAFVEIIDGQNSHFLTSQLPASRYMAGIFLADDRESIGFIMGANYDSSNCQLRLMARGDGFDNDCDSVSDEENCNGIDDDGDGLIDEDCNSAGVEAVGNNYMVMFMENNVDDNPSAVSLLEMYLTAAENVEVNYAIQTDINGWVNGTVAAGQVGIITAADLPQNLRHVGSGIDNKGISVTADRDIILYAINKQTFSTDAFLCFPTNVVGLDYYTAHYFPGQDKNQFAVAAIQDGTSVTVTMPDNALPAAVGPTTAVFEGQTYTSGQTFTFTLNRAQTAQIQGATTTDNLNGARVQSNAPISLFSGNVRARVDPVDRNSRDHLVQQLAPTDTWGRDFVTAPTPRTQDVGDLFFITARFADTNITVQYTDSNNVLQSKTLNVPKAGGYVAEDVSNQVSMRVSATGPIMLIQYVKTSKEASDIADPAMTLIPPVEQWSNNYKFITPLSGQQDASGSYLPYTYNLMVAIETSAISGLRLDGSVLVTGLNWRAVPNTNPPKSSTMFTVSFGRHSLTNTNPGVTFMALMYGAGDRESFSLPIGLKLQTQSCIPSTQTPGDNVDNDCDGSVDEELCNGVDDDRDGVIDEDCSSGDSTGTMFYLAYMDNQVETPKDNKLNLFVASTENAKSTVTVRAPLWSEPQYNSVTSLNPFGVQEYGFLPALRCKSGVKENKGISVSTTRSAVVYAVNKEHFSSDGFLVFPESALGTTYYTVSWSPSTLPTEFVVMGTTVATALVDIRLRDSTNAIRVNLEQFETFQTESANDLSGTRIDSSQRVAVFSGNIRTKIELSGSRDHLAEQMIPTTQYGTNFPLIPTPGRTVGDMIKVIPRSGNGQNSCFFPGRSFGLFQGVPQEFNLASSQVEVMSCSEPVMVVQFSKSQDGPNNAEQGDPSMTLVPSFTNFINTATFVTPAYSGGNNPNMDYTNYLTLIVQNGQQGNMRFNGNSINTVWSNVGTVGGINFVYTTLVNVASSEVHRVTNVGGASFSGRLYGRADRESYAFPIGFGFN